MKTFHVIRHAEHAHLFWSPQGWTCLRDCEKRNAPWEVPPTGGKPSTILGGETGIPLYDPEELRCAAAAMERFNGVRGGKEIIENLMYWLERERGTYAATAGAVVIRFPTPEGFRFKIAISASLFSPAASAALPALQTNPQLEP